MVYGSTIIVLFCISKLVRNLENAVAALSRLAALSLLEERIPGTLVMVKDRALELRANYNENVLLKFLF